MKELGQDLVERKFARRFDSKSKDLTVHLSECFPYFSWDSQSRCHWPSCVQSNELGKYFEEPLSPGWDKILILSIWRPPGGEFMVFQTKAETEWPYIRYIQVISRTDQIAANNARVFNFQCPCTLGNMKYIQIWQRSNFKCLKNLVCRSMLQITLHRKTRHHVHTSNPIIFSVW